VKKCRIMDKEDIDWRFNVRRRFSWFVEYFQITGTNKSVFQKVLGIDFSFSNMKKDADYNEFVDGAEEAAALEMIKDKTKKGNNFLHELAKKSYEKSSILVSTAKKVARADYSLLSPWELKVLFDGLALQLLEYQPVIFLVFPVEKYLEERLQEEISRIAGQESLGEKTSEYLSVFSMPKEELLVVREEKSLLAIAILVNKPVSVKVPMQKHLENFAWIPTDDPSGKPWTIIDLQTRINELAKSEPEKKLEKIINGEKQREQKLKDYINELDLGQETIELIQLVRDFVFLRNYRVECWVQAQYLAREFLEFIAAKANLSFEELMALSHEEIRVFLESGKIPPKQEIKKRLQAYAYIKTNEKFEVFFGNAAEKMGHFKEPALQGKIPGEIRGNIANRGIAIGTVKIVRELSDLPKVQKGDILVASMTVPQYIPAMEKAAGFITDEGGITCHAAIIARELDVPCIVGTKNATRLLKDGDKIELDANKGIARRL